MMSERKPTEKQISFSLVDGGPFHALLGMLGLLDANGLPTWRTAFVLAFFAWLPPAVLDFAQILVQADYPGWGYFQDPTVYTRYLVAIIAMVITERVADERVRILVNQFLNARLLVETHHERYRKLVARADILASAPRIEILLLLVALIWSGLSFYFVSVVSESGWEEWSSGGIVQLSWAGRMAALVSNPVFLFLMFRWLWRFGLWTWLLYRISKLPLSLVATHPDRAGGLGFLALFPGIFSGFVFALSCVVSASMLKTMGLLTTSQALIWTGILIWVAFMALVFLAPLLVFTPPMRSVKEQALIQYGKLAQIHHQAFQQDWIEGGHEPEELLGRPEPSSAADLNAIVETALRMRVVPLDLVAVLQVLIAALIPFLAVVLSQIPLTELAKWLVSAIF